MANKSKVEYKIIVESKQQDDLQNLPTEPEKGGQSLGDKLVSARSTIHGIAGFSVAVGFAKQSFDWTTSIVARNEGSSIVQQKVGATMGIAGKVGAIGGGILWSAGTGNPLGMIASIGAAVSSMMSYAKELEQNTYERKWENTGLMISRERGGSAYNRSRI